VTALKHYTRAQKDSIKAALEQIETLATALSTEDPEPTIPVGEDR